MCSNIDTYMHNGIGNIFLAPMKTARRSLVKLLDLVHFIGFFWNCCLNMYVCGEGKLFSFTII